MKVTMNWKVKVSPYHIKYFDDYQEAFDYAEMFNAKVKPIYNENRNAYQ
jgi:hypothetical protein